MDKQRMGLKENDFNPGSFADTSEEPARSRGCNKGKRTNFIRVKLAQRQDDLPLIIDIKKQESHMLSSIVHADGYIILAPDTRIQSDQKVNVFLF